MVIGAGGAGLTAALTAAEGGAQVVVFEKRPAAGGMSNAPMGFLAVGNDTQEKDRAFKSHMEHYHWCCDAGLVRAFINEQAGTIEWLKRQGVEFVDLEKGAPRVKFGYFPDDYLIGKPYLLKARGYGHGGALMIKALKARATEKDVKIHLKTPVKRIIKNVGKISGVIAEDESGKSVQVNTMAVIIASGGYGDNKEMIRQYNGFDLGYGLHGDLFMMINFKLTGDGIKMAWEVGADPGGMGIQYIYNVPGPGIVGSMPWIMLSQVRLIQGQPYLWINQQGERFINEEIVSYTVFTGHAIARQKNKCAYLIFDENTKKYMEEKGVDYMHPVFPGKKVIDLDAQIENILNQGNKNVFVGNSLAELANKMRINPDVLQRTVNDYNKCCEIGYDDLFAKDPKYLRPVRQPKFYAFRNVVSSYGTMGGIRINGRTEVLNKEHEAIPGLYATGDCAVAELYGNPPIAGLGTLRFAVNSGRIAGKNALKYIGTCP